MLGIKGYKPNFSTTAAEFIKKHRKDLQFLIGKKINSYYLQWDIDENEWNEDGVIVLQIGTNQYELTAFKLGEYSLTINQINLSQKLDWYGANDEIPLSWKKNPVDEINVVLNKEIEQIYILEHSMISNIAEDDDEKKNFFKLLTHSDFFLVGIEFELKGLKDCLQLSNGLDCNMMKVETTKIDAANRKIKIK